MTILPLGRILGTGNADTLKSMAALGDVLNLESRYPEAEKWLWESLDGRRVLLGAEHSKGGRPVSRGGTTGAPDA
jgi:hypothetical protein